VLLRFGRHRAAHRGVRRTDDARRVRRMPVVMLRRQRSSANERTKQKRTQRYSFHSVILVTPDLSSPLVAIPVLFAGGVLTSLNPCIYPMIPITAAIVGGQEIGGANAVAAGPRSRKRPLLLTLTYVIGLASVYSALGVFAGLTGPLFGAISTNPWLFFAMANLLVLSALMMFDVLPVPVPRWAIERAARAGTAGRFGGAFLMGAVSGLVAAPCGAPVMAAVLTWVSSTKSAALGFVYLLSFSLGMCALLVIVGLSSGALARLPRSGTWMVWVKRGFGIVMLAVAEYYLIKMGQVLI
jgi:cytochrome c-type biogenesis protein